MALNNGSIDIDDVTNHLAPKFGATFTALLATLEIQEMKQRAKVAKQKSQASLVPASTDTTITNLKRSADSQDVTVPSKRARAESDCPSPVTEPRTPDQPTHPSDPNWTGTSIASKDEENTRTLLKQLVMNTLSTLESDFRRIVWQQSGHRVELAQTYSTSLRILMIVRRTVQNFSLGWRQSRRLMMVDWGSDILPVKDLSSFNQVAFDLSYR